MTSARGQVIRINDAPASLTVRVQAAAGCARCAAGRGCGAGLGSSGPRSFDIELPLSRDAASLRVGDSVALDLEPGNLLRAALLAYGVPLLGAALLAAVAYAMGASEPVAAGSALLGLVAGMLASGYRSRQGPCLDRMAPRVRIAAGTGQ